MRLLSVRLSISLAVGVALCQSIASAQWVAGAVDHARALRADVEGQDWLLNGRTFSAERHSPLSQLNVGNIGGLGLDWHSDLDAPDGMVATPIVVDGRIYISLPFSVVRAIDAGSGELLWEYDPIVSYAQGTELVAISARTNRGVAVWRGKVFVTVADCRLIALDAETGEPLWEQVACDPSMGFAMTAAPHVGRDMVFVGNANSESGLRTRGHVDAYDADTGRHLWRFYTAPSHIPEENTSPAMQMAARTWTGDSLERYGGGGNAWDDLTYDPELDLLYFGTAAALPQLYVDRSPEGGDNLFTVSVVAVQGSTGEYRWHYQADPQDNWGYDLNTNIILADLPLNEESRRILMIAPKNGYFYVLDRATGELISAENFARVSWATHIDMETGRPVHNPAANYWDGAEGEFYLYPNPWGAHTWIPMSYHPGERLAYIPVNNLPVHQVFGGDGTVSGRMAIPPVAEGETFVQGHLVAWDPVTQSRRWAVERANGFNGGTMTTAGGLVFQGTATGEFEALAAGDGTLLWSFDTGSAISAAPVSYEFDGDQYVLIAVGGGGHPRFARPEFFFVEAALGPSRLLAFRLGGSSQLPQFVDSQRPLPEPPEITATPELLERGEGLYQLCSFCHGPEARGALNGTMPDLRYLPRESHEQWHATVVGGALLDRGMPAFPISLEDSEAIHAYVVSRARDAYEQRSTMEAD